MSRVDRVLRWVWLINGVLLLLILLGSAVFVAIGALSGMGGGSPAPTAVATTDSAGSAAEAPVRYDLPVPVRGTATRVVLVRRGSGYAYSSTASSAPAGGEGAVVNVAFLDAAGARLLLERAGFIRRVRFPRRGADEPGADSTLRWIVYEMALKDTNRDGAVDDRDRRSLYLTDLDGRGLRQVLPDGYELRDWAAQPDGSLVATALELAPAAGGRMRERAFVVDPAGAARPFTALDSAAAEAARITGAR